MSTVLDNLLVKYTLDASSKGLGELNSDIGQVTQSLTGLDEMINKALKGLNQYSNKLIGGGITGMVPMLGSVITYAPFEKNMALIEGLVGVQREQLDKWTVAMRGMTTEYGVTMTELAQALYQITSAGYQGPEAIEVLEFSVKAADSGLGEVPVLAKLATSAMTAYGKENLSVTKTFDDLTAAIRLGTLEPATLAPAMSRNLSLASSMGIEFEEIAGMYASMSRTGLPVDQIATQINAMLNLLGDVSPQTEEALKQINLPIEKVRELSREKGLWNTLLTVETRVGDNVELLGQIFPEKIALQGYLSLMGKALEENKDIMDGMNETAGSLNVAFEALSETVSNKFQAAMAGINTIGNQFGEIYAPIVSKVLDLVTGLLDAFIALPQWIRNIAAILSAIFPLMFVFGIFIKLVTFLVSSSVPVYLLLLKIALGFKLVKTHASRFMATFLRIGVRLIPVVGVLLLLFSLLNTLWSPTISFISGFFGALSSGSGELSAALGRLAEELRFITDPINLLISYFGDLLSAAGSAFGIDLSSWGEGFGTAIMSTLVVIIDSLARIAKAIKFLFKLVEIPIQFVLDWLFKSKTVEGVTGEVKSLYDLVTKPFRVAFDFVFSGEMFKRIMGLIDLATEKVENFLTAIAKPARLALDFLFPTDEIAAATDKTEYLRSSFLNPIQLIMSIPDMGEIIQSITNAFANFSLFEVGKAIINSLVQGMLSVKDTLMQSVGGILQSVRDFLPFSDARTGPLSDLTNSGKAIIQTLEDGMRAGGNIDIGQRLFPVGPIPRTLGAAQPANQITIDLNFGQGAIQIDAKGSDAKEIASNIAERLGESMRAVVEQVDSKVLA